jgi:spore coat polysaccharide biosynthesis protein SpsF
MRKVIILQARLASSRFPSKVLADLCGRPAIAHIVERLKAARLADAVCVAIPDDPGEDALASVLQGLDVALTRGSGPDVLGRYIQAAYETGAEIIVRATADNPLVCHENIDRQLAEISADPEIDYLITEGFPVGITVETFNLRTLEKLDYLARHDNLREHVTLYLRQHPGPFVVKPLVAPPELARPNLRLTMDTRMDYELMLAIFERLYRPGELIGLKAVLDLLDTEQAVAELSQSVISASA